MIQYIAKVDGQVTRLEEPASGCWINITPPFNHEELEDIGQRYEIPIDFLTDPLDLDERSRYEREEDVRLIIVNTPLLNELEEEIDAIFITVPVGIIITPDYFITITSFENPILKRFADGKVKNFDPADERLFVLQIFEQTVLRYLNCLKQLNLKRNLIEQELYDSSRNRELKQLLSIEKSLVYFVNSLSANELLKMKMKRTDFLNIRNDEDLTDLFEDIIIDNSQALEMANVYTNILNGTMDAYSSIISNNLNQVIHRLTIVTVVLMVPTLISSFFGMNIQNGIPEHPMAFYLTILFTGLFTGGLYWVLQRRKWF